MKTENLYVGIKFDPKTTDAESIANALDKIVKAGVLGDFLEEYGSPKIGKFFILPDYEKRISALQEALGALLGVAVWAADHGADSKNILALLRMARKAQKGTA
jgi:hypothetical protein